MAAELVKMKRKDFERLEGEALCRECILPTVYKVRGTVMSVRRRVFEELTPGQKALLAFWVVYTHGNQGWTRLYDDLPHLVGHDVFWADIKSAARHLGLPQFLESTEEFLRLFRNPGVGSAEELARVDAGLVKLLPQAVKTVGAFIRAHPGDFVQLQE